MDILFLIIFILALVTIFAKSGDGRRTGFFNDSTGDDEFQQHHQVFMHDVNHHHHGPDMYDSTDSFDFFDHSGDDMTPDNSFDTDGGFSDNVGGTSDNF